MLKTHEELKEITTLVLYGWGYPALFSKPNGDRLQNRLVSFPPHAAPTIAGASQESLKRVHSKLKLVRQRHRQLLQLQASDPNPVWVWVDAPQQLSYREMLDYREQFENWVEQTQVNSSWSDRWIDLDLLDYLITHRVFAHWRRNAIVVAIFMVMTLVMIGVQQ